MYPSKFHYTKTDEFKTNKQQQQKNKNNNSKQEAIIVETCLQITINWKKSKCTIIYAVLYYLYLKPFIWIHVCFIYTWSLLYDLIIKGLKWYGLVVVLK